MCACAHVCFFLTKQLYDGEEREGGPGLRGKRELSLGQSKLTCLLNMQAEMFTNHLFISHWNAHLEFKDEVEAENIQLEMFSKYIKNP